MRDTRAQLRLFLRELLEVQKSFVSETVTHPGALAPKLAALAHWQECVLHHPLVAHARRHTHAASSVASAMQLATSALTTAQQFIAQPSTRAPQVARKTPTLATPKWSFTTSRAVR